VKYLVCKFNVPFPLLREIGSTLHERDRALREVRGGRDGPTHNIASLLTKLVQA